VKSFYVLPFIAVAVHLFFTILPLVYANFSVGATNVFVVINEMMVYISPIITHGIYYVWGQQFDKRCNDKGDMEQRFMVKDMKFKIVVSFFLGLIPLLGIAANAGNCQSPSLLTGTSLARVNPGLGDAFIDRIAQYGLVETARKAPGCIDYVLTRNIQNPDEFRFYEKWDSAESVTKWMKQGLPVEVFRNDLVMKQLLVGEAIEVQGAYVNVQTPVKPLKNGGVHFTMGSSCKKIWKVISNWNECSWIIGCKRAQVDSKDKSLRTLHFEHTQMQQGLLDQDDGGMSLSYFNGDAKVYTGEITLYPNSNVTAGGCDATFTFHVDGVQFKVNNIYDEFLTNRIPALKKMFS